MVRLFLLLRDAIFLFVSYWKIYYLMFKFIQPIINRTPVRMYSSGICQLNSNGMNLIRKIGSWGDYHHPAFLDSIRILLGIFLFVKGFTFMEHTGYLNWVLGQQGWINFPPDAITVIIYYVIMVHMIGGALIMLGIYTRLMCLLQLPVLVAAIFMINIFKSAVNSDLYLSVTTCFLLVVFVIIGSGPFSLDKYLSENKQ
jgi:putative oxidoreductase